MARRSTEELLEQMKAGGLADKTFRPDRGAAVEIQPVEAVEGPSAAAAGGMNLTPQPPLLSGEGARNRMPGA